MGSQNQNQSLCQNESRSQNPCQNPCQNRRQSQRPWPRLCQLPVV